MVSDQYSVERNWHSVSSLRRSSMSACGAKRTATQKVDGE